MKKCPYVQMMNFNQNNFLFDVGQKDWSRIRVVSDVDEKWNEWKNIIMTVINKHAPVKKRKELEEKSSLGLLQIYYITKGKILLCYSQITS